jgi:putative membrane protein
VNESHDIAELLSHDRYKPVVYLLFVLFFIASCIAPPYPQYLLMQHAPTVVAAAAFAWFSNRFAMSRGSFTAVIMFLALHTLGCRYLYSYTPYDEWSRRLFGVSITELFGFQRNHYDRLVHCSYGVLVAPAIQEFERRHLGLSLALSAVLAVECILATSAVYEIIEWLVAVLFTPEYADQFLGQQGDIFDAEKDMSLAALGAVLSIAAVSLVAYKRAARQPAEPHVHSST